jgi:hypothetical protein
MLCVPLLVLLLRHVSLDLLFQFFRRLSEHLSP